METTTNQIQSGKKPKPFLRWTGSKNWFVKDHLDKFLPTKFNNYHECFLGGGAVFFALPQNHNSFLYDLNEDLINTYFQIKNDPQSLISVLKEFNNSKEEYYKIRSEENLSAVNSAARFIYLNRCSFNGIYRVNPKGKFNVPYGYRKNVDLITEENILRVSHYLKNTTLGTGDFENSLKNINEGDLVFIDPPYTVAHENNGFLAYNSKLFSWDDQNRLREFICQIIERNAYFIMTNACHESIYNLYSGLGKYIKLSRYSKVGGRNKTRGIYNEMVFYNTI